MLIEHFERTLTRLLGAVAILIAPVRVSHAQQPHGRLLGVFDSRTGEPLVGVQVRDTFTGTYATTTETGTVALGYVVFRGAAAMVQLRKLGYEPKQLLLALGDTLPITVTLDPVVTLAPVITIEKYRLDRDAGKWEGFEQRCQAKSVTCFRAEDLAKNPSANLADFLVRASGVTVGACGGGTRSTQCGKIAMHSNTIPPAYCRPTFFVDGFEWNPVIGSATDLVPGEPAQAPYTPANVKAVEVYPPTGARPLRFVGDPVCGAVVVWTK
jgi:hypothetical protein